MISWRHISQTTLTVLLATAFAGGVTATWGLSQGARPLSVQSGSMAPTFNKGDLVITRPVPGMHYAVGDIVTFTDPKNHQQTITHRIVAVPATDAAHSPKFLTKGDANDITDGYIPAHLIVGKVTLSLPYAGYALDFLRQPLGLLLVIYIPALVIVASEIRRLAAYYKQLEPYVIAGFDPDGRILGSHKQSSAGRHLAKASSVAIIAALGLTAPIAHAALASDITMSDSSASTRGAGPAANHPLITQIAFETNGSANNNTSVINVIQNNPQSAASGNATVSGNSGNGSASTGNAANNSSTSLTFNISHGSNVLRAAIKLFNPTNTPVDLSGWVLIDNEATYILPAATVLAPHTSYSLIWHDTSILNRAGDRLILRTNTGITIDSLSWGNDSSQLNPAIISLATTALLMRPDPHVDTDTAADWQAY